MQAPKVAYVDLLIPWQRFVNRRLKQRFEPAAPIP